MKFSVNRAPSLKYTSKFHLLFSFFFIPFRLRNGIFNYSRDTRLYRCLTLYSIDEHRVYSSTKPNTNFLSRISLSTKFWSREIFTADGLLSRIIH